MTMLRQILGRCLILAGCGGLALPALAVLAQAVEETEAPKPPPAEAPAQGAAPSAQAIPAQPSEPPQKSGALDNGLARLSCKASRGELGIFERLHILSVTIDVKNKYVKMVQEADGKTFEYGNTTRKGQGSRGFVKVTDENIVYGEGRESWKIDRYTGTLTNPSIGFHFECQLKAERKF